MRTQRGRLALLNGFELITVARLLRWVSRERENYRLQTGIYRTANSLVKKKCVETLSLHVQEFLHRSLALQRANLRRQRFVTNFTVCPILIYKCRGDYYMMGGWRESSEATLPAPSDVTANWELGSLISSLSSFPGLK